MAKTQISLKVNGQTVEALVEPRTLLIHFLREDLSLTGSHVGCDTSHCGACTVDLDGKSVKSCTVFAIQADGAEVITVEGIAAADGTLHALQEGVDGSNGVYVYGGGGVFPNLSHQSSNYWVDVVFVQN